ncbi:MAG: hypothetical protein WCF18_23755 [Chthoniobacteraceae bacterium]
MSLQYACFISYRGVKAAPYLQFIDDLQAILLEESETRIGSDAVFRDKSRLEAGQLLDPALGLNLCRSTCMIMVFIRPYFRDARDTSLWCSREFLAMTRLEGPRKAMLPGDSAITNGLIIPVIYKDRLACPPSLLQGRLYLDFSEHEKNARRLTDVPEAVTRVKQIGTYVTDQFIALESKGDELCKTCPGFTLPSVDEARIWRAGLDAPRDANQPPAGSLP